MRGFEKILLMFLLLGGCSSAHKAATTPTIPANWEYEKNAIHLRVKADPQLNLFNKTPHTLLLCVYLLRDPNSFMQLQDERDGLQKLLDCTRFDGSVLYAHPIVIQPGQELQESFDRMQDARYINLAAGYYAAGKDGIARGFPIPVREEKQGGAVVRLPQRVTIDLHLGPYGILESKAQQQDQQK